MLNQGVKGALRLTAGKEVGMVTFESLFTYTLVICTIITLVYNLTHKK